MITNTLYRIWYWKYLLSDCSQPHWWPWTGELLWQLPRESKPNEMGLNWQTDWGLGPTWMRANMSSTLCCQPGSDPGRVGPGWNQKLAQSWSEGHPHLVLIQLVDTLPPQLAIIKWLTGSLHTSTGSSWATFDAPAIPAYYHQKVALFNIFGSKLIHTYLPSLNFPRKEIPHETENTAQSESWLSWKFETVIHWFASE